MKRNIGPWALYVFAAAMLVSVMLFVTGVGVVYWGDSFQSPGWNEPSLHR